MNLVGAGAVLKINGQDRCERRSRSKDAVCIDLIGNEMQAVSAAE